MWPWRLSGQNLGKVALAPQGELEGDHAEDERDDDDDCHHDKPHPPAGASWSLGWGKEVLWPVSSRRYSRESHHDLKRSPGAALRDPAGPSETRMAGALANPAGCQWWDVHRYNRPIVAIPAWNISEPVAGSGFDRDHPRGWIRLCQPDQGES